ncbi:MAG: phosphoglycerate mutase [Chlamydiae bacterium SM23_39]|nr:MAG: phosphoglycerate mutase [Chlamydiae bacterium SM23_39]
MKLILMRHGESIWNKLNLFTGWVDVPLSEKGMQEAIEGGKKIKDIHIDVIFTSTLVRAHLTLFLAMLYHKEGKIPLFLHLEKGKTGEWSKIYSKYSKKNCIPIYKSWHLNERMYGKLQGLNKDEMRKKYGKEQVKLWRRSYKTAPPGGESLEMTAKRTLPYFKKEIVPFLKNKKNVFVSAHGNSLRAIVMYLDELSEEEVVNLEIPTGEPLIYLYEKNRWEKI